MASLFVRESGPLSLTDLSNNLNCDLSGLSQAARRLEKKMQNDLKLTEVFKSLKHSLT
jgi:phage FluMu protein gp41